MEKREGEMVSDKISWQLLSEMGGSLSFSLSLSLSLSLSSLPFLSRKYANCVCSPGGLMERLGANTVILPTRNGKLISHHCKVKCSPFQGCARVVTLRVLSI